MQLVKRVDLSDQQISKATSLRHLTLYQQTEEINYFMPLIKERVLIPVFPSTMAVTILQVILSKISGLVLDSQFFSPDTTRQLLVLCGRRGAITVGSMCGLVLMAWVTECPGEEQEGTHLQQADYHHLMQERIMGASFSGDRRNGIDSLQA
jgi:hypothetical protein